MSRVYHNRRIVDEGKGTLRGNFPIQYTRLMGLDKGDTIEYSFDSVEGRLSFVKVADAKPIEQPKRVEQSNPVIEKRLSCPVCHCELSPMLKEGIGHCEECGRYFKRKSAPLPL